MHRKKMSIKAHFALGSLHWPAEGSVVLHSAAAAAMEGGGREFLSGILLAAV